MKLNQNFVKHTIDGQTVLVPTADAPFHGLIQGNKSVGLILDFLREDTTEEAIVDKLCARFKGDKEIIKADVANVLTQLRKIGAIDE